MAHFCWVCYRIWQHYGIFHTPTPIQFFEKYWKIDVFSRFFLYKSEKVGFYDIRRYMCYHSSMSCSRWTDLIAFQIGTDSVFRAGVPHVKHQFSIINSRVLFLQTRKVYLTYMSCKAYVKTVIQVNYDALLGSIRYTEAIWGAKISKYTKIFNEMLMCARIFPFLHPQNEMKWQNRCLNKYLVTGQTLNAL